MLVGFNEMRFNIDGEKMYMPLQGEIGHSNNGVL